MTTADQYPAFTDNAIRVLNPRYLQKDLETNDVTEEPDDMFHRVSLDLAEADRLYGATDEEIHATAAKFYGMMRRLEFLPNSPTLMNAGRDLQQLSACFVLPVEDNLKSIFTRILDTAMIHQSGGGTGFSFSRLRPEGDVVRSTGGVASGPASFIRAYDAATDVVKQGGTRRGANMGILSVYHPDVEKFIQSKRDGVSLSNFNISIAVDADFIERARAGREYTLINPRTNLPAGTHNARRIFDLIVQCAWETGDPGLVFIDRINADNPNPHLGDIESTNPCVTGETFVKTTEGQRTVLELVGRPFTAVVNGEPWESGPQGFFLTGHKRVLRIITRDGQSVTLTPDHAVRTRGPNSDRWTPAGLLSRGTRLVLHNHESYNAAWQPDASRRDAGTTMLKQPRVHDTAANPVTVITDVQEAGYQDVYDVQIPGVNAFDGNGLYLHNCGEQPLLPWESCNLGSINLRRMLTERDPQRIDQKKLLETCRTAVHMLDNVIDRNDYPVPEIGETTRATRRIGVGVMGFADMLVAMNIRYDSEGGLEVGSEVIRLVRQAVDQASRELAHQRGPYPEWTGSRYEAAGMEPMRNSAPTTIAPTGTISTIAGVSSGIEPLFALAYQRHILDGETLLEINDDLMSRAHATGFMSPELTNSLKETGRIASSVPVPDLVRKVFRTSHDIDPIWHVRMQAAFQVHTENAVSKTINLPHDATAEDIKEAYLAAWDNGCKGITVYRDGSKATQVLATGSTSSPTAVTPTPRARPSVLPGDTYRMHTGHGNAYITINRSEDDEPLEVFALIGKAGSCDSVTMHALTRLISVALRSGVDPKEIISQLRGNTCCPVWDNGVLVQSSADAIAIAMERALGLERHPVTGTAAELQITVPGMPAGRQRCPECNAVVIVQSNCPQCPNCGWSKC